MGGINMSVTLATLKQLQAVDIRTVDKDSLVDIESVSIDMTKPPKEKVAEYIKQIKNPYCFKCKGYAVKLEFSDTGRTLVDCFNDYVETLK